MRSFFPQRTLGWKIVTAYGFWALILLNPRPLHGVVPEGEYGSFFDHYGGNFELLQSGDVFKQSSGDLLLIYDRTYYFQMHTGEIEQGQRTIQGFLRGYPKRTDRHMKIKKMKPAPNPEISIFLVNKLQNAYLPFHPVYCTRLNYMMYISYGEVTWNERHFRECPLAAPWVVRDGYLVRWWAFKLKDSDGVEHDFREYDVPKHYGTRESSVRGASPKSTRQIGRSYSEGRRSGSFRRLMSRMSRSLSPKKYKSF